MKDGCLLAAGSFLAYGCLFGGKMESYCLTLLESNWQGSECDAFFFGMKLEENIMQY